MSSSYRHCLHTLATRGQTLSCTRRNPGHTPVQGLPMTEDFILLPSSSKVPRASMYRSLQLKDIPSQTIIYPPPNQSNRMKLQAALCSSWHLQTLSHLSHMLSVNLLSSVKRTVRQWQTCQFWAMSTNPTRGCLAILPPESLTRNMHTCSLHVVII